jgi:hypothetical protein
MRASPPQDHVAVSEAGQYAALANMAAGVYDDSWEAVIAVVVVDRFSKIGVARVPSVANK